MIMAQSHAGNCKYGCEVLNEKVTGSVLVTAT